MMKTPTIPRQRKRLLPALTAALMSAGLLSSAYGQIQSAETLLVNVDATGLAEGPVPNIPNTGTLGGVFEANGGETAIPVIATVGGTKTIQFDGGDYLQHVDAIGGTPVLAAAGLVGENPTRSIEVWALNPAVAEEETLVSWGKRGGGDGQNISFNYGSHGAWGAVGHWGAPDLGWVNAGGAPVAGKWHHLVYTLDGTVTRVYADGIEANSETLAAGAINTHPDAPINIGAQNEADGVTVTGGLRFTGSIAKVRIHDGVLTAAQVKNNYDVEKAQFVDPAPPGLATPERVTVGPIHRYSFSEPANTNVLAGAEFRDSVGTAHGAVQGEGATFTGSRLTLPGGSSATAAYGDLPNGLLSGRSVDNGGTGKLTLELWVRATAARNWGRVFDIGSTTLEDGTYGELTGAGLGGGDRAGRDYFMLSASVGTDTSLRRLEFRNEDPEGGGIQTVDGANTTFGRDAHIVITWDEATGRLDYYEDGIPRATTTTDDKMSDVNDVNVWLGRSNWTNDENFQGEYDDVRIYDYILTHGQASGNLWVGPNALNNSDMPLVFGTQPASRQVADNSPVTLTGQAFGSGPITYQWFRGDTAIAGATNLTYTLTAGAATTGVPFTLRASHTLNGTPTTVSSAPATISLLTDTVTLKHRYSFGETSGTQITDSVGAAHGTTIGAVELAGGEATLDGIDSYIDLPNGIITGLGTNATFEMWVTYTAIDGPNWTRIFDFGASDLGEDLAGAGIDYVFYTPKDNTGVARFTADFPNAGNVATLAHPGTMPIGDEEHVVVTWDALSNVSRLYTNGVAVTNATATFPLSAMAGQDVNNWLGRSQFVADGYFGGKYNEFRLYSGAMSPSQVAASFAAGPTAMPSAAPELDTQLSGSNLIVTWDTAAGAGFVLEATPTLGAGAQWAAVTGGTTANGRTSVTIPVDERSRFLRLRKQ